MRDKKFNGWVRDWGCGWRIECTGSFEAVSKNLEKEFAQNDNRVSTLVLLEGEKPYKKGPGGV